MIGKIISDRYKVIDKLGGGGMSMVYLAEDMILERQVAIKAISIPPNEKEETLRRFEREVNNSTQLFSENIVNVYDVDEEDDCFYLIMEYIDGPTLSEYIHTHGPLNIDTAIQFTQQILNGIQEAHHKRIVHRDIKPQNILIDKNKTLKIFDFGIAKALSETSLTQTNHVLGTVQYLSPEQAKGEPTDESTDIYSIGIVLYEMLVGEPPFNGETAVSIAIKHIQDAIPNVTDIRQDVPQALSNVILKATEKDVSDRYINIQAMMDDLSSALIDSRANEDKYQHEEETVKTLAIDKNDIKSKMKESDNKGKIAQTMQIPIVNQRQFQSAEEHVFVPQKKKSSKGKKFLIALIIILLIASLAGFIAWGVFGDKYEETPDLSGKTEKEAEQLLKEKHLKLGNISRSYSDKYAENQIINSKPEAGSRINQGDAVDIVLSKGPEKVTMPYVVGMTKAKAQEKLKSLGLNHISIKKDYSRTLAKGLIAKQNLPADSKVRLNDHHIELIESLGVRQVFVKDYEGKAYSTAKKELEEDGLKVKVTTEASDSVKKGNVISQSPKDKEVDEGSTIQLKVSKGEDTDSDEDKNDEDGDSDDVKTHSETVDIPYSGKDDESQTVDIYIRDEDHKASEVARSFKIKDDKTTTISLKIKKGTTAGYTVRVDNKIVLDKDVDY
ncbi:serine/threonine protein kinase [Staphylococcus sp. HMSC068D08]|uniref:Stk1 family PASTA domain-containing Ser/Thr kinase n=1 Tax=Staphylococcus TaxID=1279 RepID=UPI0008A19F11|nr:MULTISPECIES: Stk1 family PASTA domain-containing Ser/Thr kinase [Staphylococcus]MCC2084345.1 Stk1 family PASTA domain-containing Ser/Thr kinase [Staphylococcus lugdunensis]MCH8679756.1 Stk1 family PASTA domain-containing Ser/Thr kinase [Staphylococcus lugdunensis]MCI2826754.1 Stk1 family PASTA domain-containing Ser/Thr kinase [Staphylococcus lugdunensis]MCI2835777.1 Stk1 family PASTA domain-containing Ser/Thr kinase [Staphylococcus lugdunensis]MCM3466156.1 Stk1 family PASTA domain-containi